MANIGIKDTEFIRGNVPMTKEEIRILSIAKLQLEEDSIALGERKTLGIRR